ncbi:MAG: potassium/proton antiporter [Bacteroidales bacterium]|nr:potassium/proton antiporter [Candidatus Cacconaster merdequi]
MTQFLIFTAVIIFTCVLLNNASFKVGVPVLLAFILLGMFVGNDVMKIGFDNMQLASDIASAALVFIMFYGGFGTNWATSKGVAVEAGLLATLGVIMTAALTGIFCHFILRWGWIEAMLMGSVISSTDAASVFSILRSRKLGLKNGSAPLLEIESGSNDPCSYMMTIVMLSFLKGDVTAGNVVWTLVCQLGLGVLCGWLISKGASWMLDRIKFATSGFDSLFMIAVALFSYAIPAAIGGNGYLSAYIVGIVLGNHQFKGKKEMVHFFDGFTGLMQVLIFFMLGMLAHPARLGQSLLPAFSIFLVLLFVARPLTLALLLLPFKKGRKYSFRQQALLSVCGLRGAASIVFAILATVGPWTLEHDIFNIVFCIVLLSIALQGSLIPWAAKKLDMLDKDEDVMKTFNDFADDVDIQFSEFKITSGSTWKSKSVKELGLPREMLFCLLIRKDGTKIVPNGYTILQEGDTIVICSHGAKFTNQIQLQQHRVSKGSSWIGRMVQEHPESKNSQLLFIQRGDEYVIPNGNTVLMDDDILFINKS